MEGRTDRVNSDWKRAPSSGPSQGTAGPGEGPASSQAAKAGAAICCTGDAARQGSRYRGPTRLSADHNTDGFDCGDETLDNWLKRISPRNWREGSSRT